MGNYGRNSGVTEALQGRIILSILLKQDLKNSLSFLIRMSNVISQMFLHWKNTYQFHEYYELITSTEYDKYMEVGWYLDPQLL